MIQSGCVGVAVHNSEHAVVGVHRVLNFRHRVALVGVERGQDRVDGVQVVRIHAGDARIGVGLNRRDLPPGGRSFVVLMNGENVGRIEPVDESLKFGEGVGFGAVIGVVGVGGGGCDAAQNDGQVAG